MPRVFGVSGRCSATEPYSRLLVPFFFFLIYFSPVELNSGLRKSRSTKLKLSTEVTVLIANIQGGLGVDPHPSDIESLSISDTEGTY